MIYDSTPPKSIMDPFRRAVNDHIQERKRQEEERLRGQRECPHNGEVTVQELSHYPTAYGMKVGKYLCVCHMCGLARYIEPEE
jgi:hypothetical protein